MKHLTASTIVLFLLMNASASGQEAAARPVYKDGDWWKIELKVKLPPDVSRSACQDRYSEYTVKIEQGKAKVYGGSDQIDCPLIAMRILGLPPEGQKEEFRESAQFEYLKFPLKAGMSWSNRVMSVTRRAKTKWDDLTYKVLAWEKMKTPKGEFDGFKIQVSGWDGGQIRTYHYAPAAKAIVWFELTTKTAHAVSTLVDFNLGQ